MRATASPVSAMRTSIRPFTRLPAGSAVRQAWYVSSAWSTRACFTSRCCARLPRKPETSSGSSLLSV